MNLRPDHKPENADCRFADCKVDRLFQCKNSSGYTKQAATILETLKQRWNPMKKRKEGGNGAGNDIETTEEENFFKPPRQIERLKEGFRVFTNAEIYNIAETTNERQAQSNKPET